MPTPTERLVRALSDRYRIEREVGSGGMATVYLAEDLKHHRQVAVKVLRPDIAATLGGDRFLREIEIAARLTHPHILPLHDSGEADDFLYYVMPYVEGESLRAKLAREGELPVGEAVRILEEVVDALAYAHQHGVVHRDIKPDNVLLTGHHAMVTDFGVAKAVSEATGRQQLTTAGVALGTPAYMSPEQAAADPNVDHRADIYAVGAMAYEMLAGQPPFTGTTAQQVLSAHIATQPTAVTEHRSTVPAALAEAVMRCLEKKPADRWQSAAELQQQLATMVTPSGGITPSDTKPVKVPLRAARNGKRWAAVVGAVVVLGLVGFFALRGTGKGAVPALNTNLLAVMPFRVAGADPELSYLREGMIDLMAAKLTGEGGPRAADPRTVTAAWRDAAGSADGDLSEAQARQVASKIGAGQLLLGGIVGSHQHMVLSATVLSTANASDRTPASVEGPADSLPVLLDRLIGQILARRAGVASERLASLTTTSLDALQAYLEGQRAYRHGRYGDAAVALSRALQIDSTFALAAYSLLLTAGWFGGVVAEFPNIDQRAWALRDRLSQRDQTLLEAYLGPNGPAPDTHRAQLEARERAVQLVPDQADAWYFLGDEYYHWGKALGYADAHERAERAFQRALELDSGYVGIMGHMAHLRDEAGDTAAMRRLATRVLDEDSTTRDAEWWRWRLAQQSGDAKGIAAERGRIDTIAGGTRDIVLWMQTDGIGLESGDLDAALDALDRGATSANERTRAAFVRSMTELNRGRPAAALPVARRLPDGGSAFLVQAALYGSGDTAAAAAVVREGVRSLEEPLPKSGGQRFQRLFQTCLLGYWLAWHADSRATSAIARLRATQPGLFPPDAVEWTHRCALEVEAIYATRTNAPRATTLADRLDSIMLDYPETTDPIENLILARIFEAQGRPERALAASRRRVYNYGEQSYLASSLLMEGRAAQATGNRDEAIKAYTHYLALRANPEPSVQPEVDAVKAELARLTSETGAGNR